MNKLKDMNQTQKKEKNIPNITVNESKNFGSKSNVFNSISGEIIRNKSINLKNNSRISELDETEKSSKEEKNGNFLDLKSTYKKNKSSHRSEFYSQTEKLKTLLEKEITEDNQSILNRTNKQQFLTTFKDPINNSIENKPRVKTNKNSNLNMNSFNNSDDPLSDVKEKLELFKSEILKEIKKLDRSEEKLQELEIYDQLSHIKENFNQSMNEIKDKSENESEFIKKGFEKVKDDVTNKLNERIHENREVLNTLAKELKEYKNEISVRISELENKQRAQLEGIKFLLNISSDPRTNQSAEQFLNENFKDLETFQDIRNHFVRPTRKEITKVTEDIKRKTQNKFEISHDPNTVDEIQRKIKKTVKFNEQLKSEINVNNENKTKDKKDLLKSIFKRLNQNVQEERIEFELKPLNHFRKYVVMVIFMKRLEKFLKFHKQNILLNSLNEFTSLFIKCDESLKIFLKENLKSTINSFTNFPKVKMDFIEYLKLNNSNDEEEAKNMYIKLEVRLKTFFDNLIENTTQEKFPPDVLKFFRLFLVSENYLPFNFFSLFEMSRIEIMDDLFFSDFREKHFAMILCMYILNKIVVKHFILDINLLPENKKNSLNSVIIKNLKIFASIIFLEVIKLFKKQCPIVNLKMNIQEIQKNQKIVKFETIDVNKLQFRSDCYRSYKESVKKYYYKQDNKKDTSEDSIKERELLDNINQRLGRTSVDNDVNTIEYIQNFLFKENEIGLYYRYAERNGFDLMVKIFIWVKRLIKLIKDA